MSEQAKRKLRAIRYNISTGDWSGLKHFIKWDTGAGTVARNLATWLGVIAMRLARSMFRWSLGRCSYCGQNCGMSSQISSKGLRCSALDWDCWRKP